MENSAMAQTNAASNRKRLKKAVPVLGIAGMSLSLASGASAATTGPATDTPAIDTTQRHQVFLGEEEMSDVRLGGAVAEAAGATMAVAGAEAASEAAEVAAAEAAAAEAAAAYARP
jgi:hypothetical protein